jgi:hypothetical protein
VLLLAAAKEGAAEFTADASWSAFTISSMERFWRVQLVL